MENKTEHIIKYIKNNPFITASLVAGTILVLYSLIYLASSLFGVVTIVFILSYLAAKNLNRIKEVNFKRLKTITTSKYFVYSLPLILLWAFSYLDYIIAPYAFAGSGPTWLTLPIVATELFFVGAATLKTLSHYEESL